MNNQSPDSVLWSKFLAGDANAFANIIRLYYNDLYNYGARFTHDGELVKDCIQEVWITLWKNRSTISETLFVKYYLLKSLRRNLTRAFIKNAAKGREWDTGFLDDFEPALNVEENIVSKENMAELSIKLHSLLQKLSRRQQEIIYLRFYLDADIPEIADIMSINRQSVYNLLYDALKKLKGMSDMLLLLLYYSCFMC